MKNLVGRTARDDRGRLLVVCPDRPGIVADVSQFLARRGGNIVHLDEHTTDPAGGEFFMRLEFALEGLEAHLPALEREFAPIARRHRMDSRFVPASHRKRVAVLVSKEDHCLLELLWRWRSGDLDADIAMVLSNHPDLGDLVRSWNLPFHHVPVTPATRAAAERRQRSLLRGRCDVVVLARYMQVLSPGFLAEWPDRVINIHHSFLPAFAGARPYHQAHERGVKLIGATAHFATSDLDAGPIIEQDITRVDHRHSVEDLRRIGRYIERVVLARAVGWYVEDRVLVHGGKTVVFA